jgi:DNA primase
VTPEVVFCFDGDRAGRAAAWRALENALPEAQDGRTLRFLFLPDGEDPDTLVRKEGQAAFEERILRESLPLSDYLLGQLTSQTDMRSEEGRARLANLAAPHFNRLPAGAFRELLRKRLAQLTELGAGELSMLNPARTAAGTPAPKARVDLLLGPADTVLAYLLLEPALALVAPDPEGLDMKGLELFKEVLEFVRNDPQVKVATILEHWRENPEIWTKLNKLAQAELAIPEGGLEKQFLAHLVQFRSSGPQARRDWLIAEAKKRELNAAEKAEMTQLLTQLARKPGTDSVKSN